MGEQCTELLVLLSWDWAMGMPYEYSILKRRKDWKWPMLVRFVKEISR